MAERALSQQSSRRAGATNAGAVNLELIEAQMIQERINEIYDAVARRAFELFENDGRVDGRDRDHWFRAEAELLHPAHVQVREEDGTIVVDAEVPGFSAEDLEVSMDPRRVTISGRREAIRDEEKRNVLYSEGCSCTLLRSIELPVEVNASRATATLNNGILELTAPKAGERRPIQAKAAGAA